MPRFNTARVGGGFVEVQGYQSTIRAFNKVGKAANKNIRKRLKQAAEPVRSAAQEYGPSRIRNLKRGRGPGGADWGAVRTGVTARWVYIAPTARGVKGRGNERFRRGTSVGTGPPSFDDLVLSRAYEPALADNQSEVVEIFSHIFDDIVDAWVV